MTGTSEKPIKNIVNSATWDNLQYPALNGNSALLPFPTSTQLYQNGVEVWSAWNDCPTDNCAQITLQQYCHDILDSKNNTLSFDTLVGEYIPDVASKGYKGSQWMLRNYMSCLNTPGMSEQWCAAQDKCAEELYEKSEYVEGKSCATTDEIDPYMNTSWVAGNCSSTKSNE